MNASRVRQLPELAFKIHISSRVRGYLKSLFLNLKINMTEKTLRNRKECRHQRSRKFSSRSSIIDFVLATLLISLINDSIAPILSRFSYRLRDPL